MNLSFESVLVAALGDLRAIARGKGLTHADCDDAVQAVCWKALERRGQFSGGPSDQRAWLATIMRNSIMDLFRANGRRGTTHELPPNARAIANPEATVELKQVCEYALANVSEKQREALVLAAVGYEGSEGGAVLGICKQSFNKRLQSAREELGGLAA